MFTTNTSFRHFVLALAIVWTAALTSCGGGGATTTTATDGTTIAAGTPDVNFIYIATSASSNKKAGMKFNVSKQGVAQPNVGVTATLNAQALAAGVTFFGGATTLSLTTDATGNTATFYVVSGSIPTSVVVKGTLSNNSSVADFSTSITVSSGSPTQDRFGLGVELGKSIMETWSYIGDTVSISAYIADRLGNPVPDGTPINFTSSAGATVTSACTTTNSSCLVTATISGGKITPWLTILASTAGEESFIDTNGNNKYDLGEVFTDLGNIYRDDNLNGVFDLGEQITPTAGSGSSVCPISPVADPTNKLYSVPSTCDGLWTGNVLIRQKINIYMAESRFIIDNLTQANGVYTFNVRGQIFGGRAPNGAAITVTFPTLPTGITCTVGTLSNSPVTTGSAATGTSHSLLLSSGCSGQDMQVQVSTPKSIVSTQLFTAIP